MGMMNGSENVNAIIWINAWQGNGFGSFKLSNLLRFASLRCASFQSDKGEESDP